MKIIRRVFEKIDRRSKHFQESPETLESLGYQIHNLYCAFEDLFQVVARYFENNIEKETQWHKYLLKRMKLEIEGIRPALISSHMFRLLDELRSFRHFFRHAYSYELEVEKMGLLVEKAKELESLYEEEFSEFLARIKADIGTDLDGAGN